MDRWEKIREQSQEAIEEIRRRLKVSHFNYIDLETAEPLYFISVGFGGWVCVIGHPDHGSYEWVGLADAHFDDEPNRLLYHSDCGYGGPDVAMRDGLIRMLD